MKDQDSIFAGVESAGVVSGGRRQIDRVKRSN